MEWLLTLLPYLLGPLIGIGGSALTSRRLTGAQNQQNDWNAQQAQQANEWNQYNYQHRYQWQTQDMQAAGLNPALMYGGSSGVGSVPGTTPASGSFAGNPSDPSSMISAVLEAALLKSQIKKTESEADLNVASAENQRSQASERDTLLPHEIDKIAAEVQKLGYDMAESEARTDLALANAALANQEQSFRDRYNDIQIRLGEANIAKSDAERERILQETRNLIRDWEISFARQAEIKANAGLLSQETRNALVQNGILKENQRTAKFEADIAGFQNDHKKQDRIWNNVSRGFGMARDAGVAAGAVAGGFLRGVAKGASNGSKSRSITEVFGASGQKLKTSVTESEKYD